MSSTTTRNGPSLDVIEISSDSEDDVIHQPHPRSILQSGNKHHKSGFVWENDVIELTDSESSNSSHLPDMLSPLIKKPRKKEHASWRKQKPPEGFVSLFLDTSDEGESDKGAILVLNDPPCSQRPIQTVLHAKGVGQDGAKKNATPGFSQVAQKPPSKRTAHKAKEQVRRQEYATELFVKLNKDVFGDRLPKNTALQWSKRLLTTAGRAHWHRSHEGLDTTNIELASKILDCDERIRNTLSHEMCHLACWVIDDRPRERHGQNFKSWANKVMSKYPDIHISTQHSYEISYPYEWKCEKCKTTYGRHSKSIRPDQCVCGACKMGKLIPLFTQRKPMTPKVSQLAMAKPRDSPYSMVGSPTKNGLVMQQTSLPSAIDIPGLANALRGISIDKIVD